MDIKALLCCLTLLMSCTQTKHSKSDKQSSEEPSAVTTSSLSNQDFLKSMQTNCYVCHNPATKSHDDILAPPLAAVKFRYNMQYQNRENFIEGMTNFINEPKKENALMRGAVKRFNLMPLPSIGEEAIRQIVTYIYDNKLEEPEWFGEHFEEEHGK